MRGQSRQTTIRSRPRVLEAPIAIASSFDANSLRRRCNWPLQKSLIATALLAAILTAPSPNSANAVVRITDDRGGNIGAYWSRFTALRDAGEQIVIDGTCSSACTMVLGIVPFDRICVTPNAVLGFHAAWRPGFLGLRVLNEPATRTLLSFYPIPIRKWVARNGGLGFEMMYLSGPELFTMLRPCR